jgi:hypothetical protein
MLASEPALNNNLSSFALVVSCKQKKPILEVSKLEWSLQSLKHAHLLYIVVVIIINSYRILGVSKDLKKSPEPNST